MNWNVFMGGNLIKDRIEKEIVADAEVMHAWKMGYEMKVGNMAFSEPKYRVANGKLISYRELCFSNIKETFVKEIWIGPKADMELRDIMQVLERY